MMRYLCPPCVHPFVHLLSLLSLFQVSVFYRIWFPFLSFAFSVFDLFLNMYLDLLQFGLSTFLLLCFSYLCVFAWLSFLSFFSTKKVSIFVFILLCFWTFSSFALLNICFSFVTLLELYFYCLFLPMTFFWEKTKPFF